MESKRPPPAPPRLMTIPPPKGNTKVYLILLGLFLCAIFGYDHWYQYRSLARRPFPIDPNSSATPLRPGVKHVNQKTRGNLAGMIKARRIKKSVMRKGSSAMRADQYGFNNPPDLFPQSCQVTATGDSFLFLGEDFYKTFPMRLAKDLGEPVYNASSPGVGPVSPILRYVSTDAFKKNKPKVLVWGFTETAIFFPSHFKAFKRRPLKWKAPNLDRRIKRFFHVWLRASALKRRAVPLIADVEDAFGTYKSKQVVISKIPKVGPVLFYKKSMQIQSTPRTMENLEATADLMANFDQWCRDRGITLITFIIPEKAEMMEEWVPQKWIKRLKKAGAYDLIPTMNRLLKERGMEIVDISPALRASFLRAREAAEPEKEVPFIMDDTHWSPAGMDASARVLTHAIRRILNPPGGDGIVLPSPSKTSSEPQ